MGILNDSWGWVIPKQAPQEDDFSEQQYVNDEYPHGTGSETGFDDPYGYQYNYDDDEKEEAEQDPYAQLGNEYTGYDGGNDYTNQFGDGNDANGAQKNETDPKQARTQADGDRSNNSADGGNDKSKGQDPNNQNGMIQGLDEKQNARNAEKDRRMSQSSKEDKEDRNLKFDTVFLKKYYRRIRNHILIKETFDILNTMAAPYILTGISIPSAFFDHLVCLIKPKYVMTTHKLDCIIELVLVDDGIISSLFYMASGVLDFVLGLPIIEKAGKLIISLCKKAGIFNDTFMAINQGLVRHDNAKKERFADSESKRLAHEAQKERNKGEHADQDRIKRLEAQSAGQRAESDRRTNEDKVMRNDYRADRRQHGLGAGYAGLAEGVMAAKDGGLGAGLKAGIGTAWNESNLGRGLNSLDAGIGAFKDARDNKEGVLGSLKAGLDAFKEERNSDPDANDMSDRHLRSFGVVRDENGKLLNMSAEVDKNQYDKNREKKEKGKR
jgi:hypothetical protein